MEECIFEVMHQKGAIRTACNRSEKFNNSKKMNKFDLEKFGVQGLESKEMVEVDGGVIITLGVIAKFVVGAWLADSTFNLNETREHFMKGYNSVKENHPN